MVIEAGVVAGYLIAWAVRKARYAGGRLDAEVDLALDAGLEKLHGVVAGKLAGQAVLADLEDEAQQSGVSGGDGVSGVDDLTRQRLEMELTAAARKDELFAAAVTTLIQQIQHAERVSGPGAITVTGGVHADHGSAAAVTMGNVTIGQVPPDPSRPGRSDG
ncbi:hypothetical protein KIH74_11030 [Kineosporia sp. J2-2]|uniref:Chromosome partitioning protein n=1 Tax=Kineosporia corallincola TaxID=2835133 RepID=A0ABS5TEG4_9ACTN|nr:hypothetical protein [Kineosporia corallincola]MBT0769456.1 hypothetical protein [Kineosporia corallincola]